MDQDTASWDDVTKAWVNNWTETGNQIWKSWLDWIETATANGQEKNSPDLTSFTQNQPLLMRFLKLSLQAWQEILPKAQAGENWQQILTNYSQQIQNQFNQFSTSSAKISEDASELWQLYLQQLQKFNQVWGAYLESSLNPLSQTSTGSSQPWIELNNLYWDMFYQPTVGNLFQTPTLGVSREFNNKILKGFEAWTNLYRASVNYQILLTHIQVQSFEALMQELVTLAEKGEPITDWRKFQDLWSRIFDEGFEKAFLSEVNLKTQGNFLNALNAYRMQQQDLLELWLNSINIPTRTEVDEIHKTIYELRKEVKQLKKRLAKYEEN